MTKNGKPTLNDIFGTKNKALQAERAGQLFNPVIDLIVRFDGRFGNVTIDAFGGHITPSEARQVLQKAIEGLNEKEAEMLAQQKLEEAQAPPPPPPYVGPEEGTIDPDDGFPV